MPKKPEFTIHIGGQKSGSSAIQGYLFFNRYTLKKQGLVYLDENFGNDMSKAISHNRMLSSLKDLSHKEIGVNAKNLYEQSKDNIIFSSEGLCRMKDVAVFADKFSEYKEMYDVKIVIYIRNQVELLYSGWQQWGILQGLDFEAWVEKALLQNRANWQTIISCWASSFGTENMKIKVYHPDNLRDKDIVADFIERTDIPLVKSKVPNNANYSFADLAVMVIVTIASKHKYDLKKLLHILKKNPPSFLKLSKENIVLTEILKKKITDYYANSNETLFEDFSISIEEQTLYNSPRVSAIQEISIDTLKALSHKLEVYIETNKLYKKVIVS
jgi:hypothetical protein